MNGESIAGQCISHHFSCLPNLIPKKRDSSHGNRDKEGRVGMSSFKSSSSSGEREVAVEVAEMSASAGGKRAGMKLRRGRREGINKQTRGRKRSSPPGFDPPSTPTPSPEAHAPTPSLPHASPHPLLGDAKAARTVTLQASHPRGSNFTDDVSFCKNFHLVNLARWDHKTLRSFTTPPSLCYSF